MPVFIRCPDCQKLLKVKEELAGKRVKCPSCGVPVRVPAAETEVVGVEEVVDLPTEEPVRPPSQDLPLTAAEMELPDVPARESVRPIPRGDRGREPAAAPRREREDDYEREQPPLERVPFPAVVTVAGSIWIFFGIMILLATFAQLAMLVLALAAPAATTPPPPPNRPGQTRPLPETAEEPANKTSPACSFVCVGLLLFFGAVFLNVGIQSVRGRAAGTLANGLGSLGFGVIYGGLGGMMLMVGTVASVGNVPTPGMSGGSLGVLILGGVYALAGALLLLAGLLALIGYRPYQAWRRAEKAARQQLRR